MWKANAQADFSVIHQTLGGKAVLPLLPKFLSVKLGLVRRPKQLPTELQNPWIEVASWRMSRLVYINQSSPTHRQKPLCSQCSSWQNKCPTYSRVFFKVGLDERWQCEEDRATEEITHYPSIIGSSVLSAATNRSWCCGILNQGGVV